MKKNRIALSGFWSAFLLFLPDEFSKFRVRYYNKIGCIIHISTSISQNVKIRGKFEINEGSSIAQNCIISGENVGVYIEKNEIAPTVVIVAFSHGFKNLEQPIVKQPNVESPYFIEDNVWTAANCTIGKGAQIGSGSIIAANSFVNKDIPPFGIAGGEPAKIIQSRVL